MRLTSFLHRRAVVRDERLAGAIAGETLRLGPIQNDWSKGSRHRQPEPDVLRQTNSTRIKADDVVILPNLRAVALR